MGKSSPHNRDVNAARRVALAVELRMKKMTYDEIAKRCGYGSAGAAHKAVMREMQRTIVANVEQLRREELASLEHLEQECWKRLDDSTFTKSMLFAVDRILAIQLRRAALMGLDAPRDGAVAANMTVIREIPPCFLGQSGEAKDG